MSATHEYSIKCPKCGHEQTVQLYESVNVTAEPELKDRLLRNGLNAVTCAACTPTFTFRVDKPLFYQDPGRGVFIFLLPTPVALAEAAGAEFEARIGEMVKMLPPNFKAPVIHLALSRLEMVERIFMLEAGLNVRLVEYVKYLVYTRNAARLAPDQKNLLFNAQDSDDTNLAFVVQDEKSRQLEALIHFERTAYQALQETFAPDGQDSEKIMELFPGPYISGRVLARDALRDGTENEAAAGAPP